ncbi:hypothetical protein LCC91_03025 [Tepidimonas taiwanensis]|nr:hypothetical protein [Tepidimonas taiwanensis]UBQ05492.1 hypothetical protein LCC91_13435 [Tepidimonas taiwanensis]UBQ06095.1 hypothetical protein LCC91_03025 [Tepidimonas taiwanensis]
MLEVQQADHDAQRHARPPRAAGAPGARALLTEEVDRVVQRLDSLAAGCARQALRDRVLEPLPRHALCQHRQWVAHIDHVLQTQPEKILAVHALGHGQNSQQPRRGWQKAGRNCTAKQPKTNALSTG